MPIRISYMTAQISCPEMLGFFIQAHGRSWPNTATINVWIRNDLLSFYTTPVTKPSKITRITEQIFSNRQAITESNLVDLVQ
jgi:hypothetical protein